MTSSHVVVVPDAEALAHAAAMLVAEQISAAPAGRPASVALAGGGTPRAAYRELARLPVDWSRTLWLFGDERCVPPDAEGSNHAMAHDALLGHIPITAGQVVRIPGELEPQEAARAAEADLRERVPGDPWPVLDVALLGIGPDGHTASLFPGGPETDVVDRAMVPVHRPEMPQPWRVSMTLPVLNSARAIVVLAAGAEKAPVVARALAGDPALPAGRLRRDPSVTWILGADAAPDHLPA